jgi:hypothetical protein
LIAAARGADLLVHEVVLAPPDVDLSAPYYGAFAHHTTPEQSGAVFAWTPGEDQRCHRRVDPAAPLGPWPAPCNWSPTGR